MTCLVIDRLIKLVCSGCFTDDIVSNLVFWRYRIFFSAQSKDQPKRLFTLSKDATSKGIIFRLWEFSAQKLWMVHHGISDQFLTSQYLKRFFHWFSKHWQIYRNNGWKAFGGYCEAHNSQSKQVCRKILLVQLCVVSNAWKHHCLSDGTPDGLDYDTNSPRFPFTLLYGPRVVVHQSHYNRNQTGPRN